MTKPYRPGEVVAQIRALSDMARRLRGVRSALPRLEANKRAGFAGDLVQMSITAVLTVLEIERRSGSFEVTSEAGTVSLELAGGTLIRGAANGKHLAPIGALRIMISRKTGTFSFEPSHAASPATRGVAITDALNAALRLERATPVQNH